MKEFKTASAPAAIGPYSQAIIVDGTLYTSGQIPLNPATGELPAGIEAQAAQALTNLKNIITGAGSAMNRVIKTTVFIKDINDFAKVNEIYATFFEQPYPARSCVEVARLPKDVLIEIEAVAKL